MTERERTAQRTYGPNQARTVEQFYTMYVFDELIRNQDRNQGNMLWTSDWKMWLIDHTRAFRPQVEITEPLRLTRVRRDLLDNLRALTPEALEEATGDYLERLAAIEVVAETRPAGRAFRRAHRQARRGHRPHRPVAVESQSSNSITSSAFCVCRRFSA